MKRVISEDYEKLRREAYRERDAVSLGILWDVIHRLDIQGIDIGAEAKAELAQRADIKLRYKKP